MLLENNCILNVLIGGTFFLHAVAQMVATDMIMVTISGSAYLLDLCIELYHTGQVLFMWCFDMFPY